MKRAVLIILVALVVVFAGCSLEQKAKKAVDYDNLTGMSKGYFDEILSKEKQLQDVVKAEGENSENAATLKAELDGLWANFNETKMTMAEYSAKVNELVGEDWAEDYEAEKEVRDIFK